jgi:hypothetical protein
MSYLRYLCLLVLCTMVPNTILCSVFVCLSSSCVLYVLYFQFLCVVQSVFSNVYVKIKHDT